MKKINRHIEIVYSSLDNSNSIAYKSCQNLQRLIGKRYTRVGLTLINTESDIEILIKDKPDLVFLGVTRAPSTGNTNKSVQLASLLDNEGILYTGSDSGAMIVALNKNDSKVIVKQAGLDTARFFTATVGQYDDESQLPLGFPMFVKPTSLGGGNGIGDDSVVYSFSNYEAKVKSLFEDFGAESLVEEYLTGREFSVGILETEDPSNPIVMPIELTSMENDQGNRILGKSIKTDDNEKITSVNDKDMRSKLVGLALGSFKALNGRGHGRVDIRMNDQGVAQFLEINLKPGLGTTGYLSRASSLIAGMDYEQMILHIVNFAFYREVKAADRLPKLNIIDSIQLPKIAASSSI